MLRATLRVCARACVRVCVLLLHAVRCCPLRLVQALISNHTVSHSAADCHGIDQSFSTDSLNVLWESCSLFERHSDFWAPQRHKNRNWIFLLLFDCVLIIMSFLWSDVTFSWSFVHIKRACSLLFKKHTPLLLKKNQSLCWDWTYLRHHWL